MYMYMYLVYIKLPECQSTCTTVYKYICTHRHTCMHTHMQEMKERKKEREKERGERYS